MRGTTLILLAAALWGTTGTAQALGPDASPLAVGALRLIVGGAILAGIALVVRSSRSLAWLVRPTTLTAAVGMAAYQPAFFTAVDRTGVAVGTVIALGTAPLFVGLLEWALTRRPPSHRWVLTSTPALAGLVIVGLSSNSVRTDGLGMLAALGAGLAYAVYATSAARLSVLGPAHESAGVVFGLAALLLVPLALATDLSWVVSAGGVATVAWLAVMATALAYLLFTAGLRTTGTPTASTLTLAEPVTATVLAVALLSERPGPLTWTGIVLMIVGLALTARSAGGDGAADRYRSHPATRPAAPPPA